MPELLVVEGSVLEVLLEPRFGRWHASASCPVLAAQPDASVRLAPGPGVERACTICADVGVAAVR